MRSFYTLLFIKTILVTFLFGSHITANGQLCGYDYHHLYILDLRFEGQNEQAKNIAAWLVDENLKPYMRNRSVRHKKGWKTVEEPVAILPCSEVKNNGRVEFPRASGFFVVMVNSFGPNEKHPPVYQAMIVAGADTTVVRLPYEKSIDICANHAHSDEKYFRDRPMLHHDGTPFEPFKITLQKPTPATSRNTGPLDRVLFKFDTDELNADKAAENKTAIKQIRILDYATLAEIQVLKPSYRHYFYTYRQADFIRETDVFGDNPTLLPDIILTTRVESNEAGTADEYKDFFLFNPQKQLWERSPLLSDYPNVMLNGQGKPITRLEKKRTDKEIITTLYELEKGKWVVRHSEVESLPPVALVPDKTLETKDCLSFVDGNLRWLPVHLATDEHYATVRDTFRVQNNCIGNVALKAVSGSPTKGFSFPDIVGPRATQSVLFEKSQAINLNNILMFEDWFSIETGAGYAKTLTLRYFIAGKNTPVHDSKTGRITKYREQATDKLTAFELWVDENGLPEARGHVLAKSGTRVGQWLFMSPDTPLMPDTVYSKRFILLLGEDWSADLMPEIRDKGLWKVPEFIQTYQGFQFYCTPETDSIRVRASDRVADMAYDYARSTDNSGGQLWLIGPGESYFFNGSAKVPLGYSDHAYVIGWNYSELQKTNTLPMDLADEVATLAKKFPSVTFVPYDDIPGHYQVNTAGLTEKDRAALLDKLESHPYIWSLSRIVYPMNMRRPTYGDKNIMVVFHNEANPSQFAETTARYGFEIGQPLIGVTHYYQATWKYGRFDRDMIEAAGALAREKIIKNVDFNWHMRIEHDRMHEDVQFPYEPK